MQERASEGSAPFMAGCKREKEFMAKINPAAPIGSGIPVLSPVSIPPKSEEPAVSEGAVTVSVRGRAAARPQRAASDDAEQLVDSIFSGLADAPSQALAAAGLLSADRVRDLLK